MKNQYFFALILFAFAYGFSAEVETKDYMFSEGYLALEGGEAYPWGLIEDAVQPSLYGQGEFYYRYWENTYGLVQFDMRILERKIIFVALVFINSMGELV